MGLRSWLVGTVVVFGLAAQSASALTLGPVALPAQSASALTSGPAALPACSWPVKVEADVNVAYPDRSATYWFAAVPVVPGTQVVIRGRYPKARYFSFHAYDAAERPVGAIADLNIDPDAGSANPFRTAGAAADGRYTVKVVWAPKPADPAPNTLYAGAMGDGTPNPIALILYRVYVPDDAASEQGGVALPEVALQSATGSGLLSFRSCEVALAPLPASVSSLDATTNFPAAVPRVLPVESATNPPTLERSYGIQQMLIDRLPSNAITDLLPGGARGSFFGNVDNAYLLARLSRTHGEAVVLRLKPPTFPDTRAGESVVGDRQVRFWSLCENDMYAQRVVDCLADHQVVRGADGDVVVVISDPAQRPANATRANGVNWLAWGGLSYNGLLMYRQMLPAPSFAQAIQRVDHGVSPGSVMGEYMPKAAYCTKAKFEAGGAAACL